MNSEQNNSLADFVLLVGDTLEESVQTLLQSSIPTAQYEAAKAPPQRLKKIYAKLTVVSIGRGQL